MEHFLAIKKNEFTSFEGKWMELEIIILSEISHLERQIPHFLSHMQNLIFKNE
jgi:hypothetical protein